jgi:CRP-like cAMP-binding protein
MVCKNEYFVNKGCLRTFTIDKNGFEHIGLFAVEDWYTGDIYSFMTETPSERNIVAMEDSEIIQLSKENWQCLLLQIPKFEKFYRIKFQNSLISLQKRMIESL